MMSEEEERPRFVTGGYVWHRRQWVNWGPFSKERFTEPLVTLGYTIYQSNFINITLFDFQICIC